MTPEDQARVADGSRQPGVRRGPTPVRRIHMRRRVTAVGALIVLVILFAIMLSGGSNKSAGNEKAAASGIEQAEQSNNALLAVANEQARQQRAIANVLAYTPFVTAGGPEKRMVALTFDDGPGPFTPQVLDELDRLHVPATFFVVGRSLRDFGTYLPRELAENYVVGDHTQDHVALAQLSARDQQGEVLSQAAAIGKLGAPYPRLFRPPYGSYNTTTLSVTKRLGMLTVLWTIDTSDFRQPGTPAIVDAVLGGIKPGAIVLMHDAGGQRQQTIAAIPMIVNALRSRGYQLVTVPRLLADDPPPRTQSTVVPNLVGG